LRQGAACAIGTLMAYAFDMDDHARLPWRFQRLSRHAAARG
jgi:hypothetical protein